MNIHAPEKYTKWAELILKGDEAKSYMKDELN